jgi:redox-sensing transcriptional repressor
VNKVYILRLSNYLAALKKLKSLGFIKVFSENLADAVGVASSQVRKDFSLFGISGQKKGGYQVDQLLEKINYILGKDKVNEVVIVGAGHIGAALMRYKGFEKEGIKIVAAFDNRPDAQNPDAEIPVYPMEKLAPFLKKRGIKTGIIAVPDIAAQGVVDEMINAGIRGVLNFAPIRLRVPEETIINNVDLRLELENVLYFVNALEKNKKEDSHDQK